MDVSNAHGVRRRGELSNNRCRINAEAVASRDRWHGYAGIDC
jgi:hypothetical protein